MVTDDFSYKIMMFGSSYVGILVLVVLQPICVSYTIGDGGMDVEELANFKSKDLLDSVANVILQTYPR